jgi:hypothetical protein
LSELVSGLLQIANYTRVGTRFFYTYPTKSEEDAERILATSPLFSALHKKVTK